MSKWWVLTTWMAAAGCDCAGYQTKPGEGDPDGDAGPCGTDGCDCDEVPTGMGCPCDELEPAPCYDGDPALTGIGICQTGLRTCTNGAWSHCAGQVLPAEEVCDELDNDCDGEVDDGVLSECGDCSEDCRMLTWGGGDGEMPFAPDESNSNGVETEDDGSLVLAGDTFQLHVIWISNTVQGTISKIDTESLEELGRYRTGPLDGCGFFCGDDPSRTSLNYYGDAHVANRNGGTVTKILERDCPDRDGDGRVLSSISGDDVLGWGDDECVEWNTQVAAQGRLVRAIAVQTRLDEGGAAREYVWAGVYSDEKYVELDAQTGEETGREVLIPPCHPYGAAIDRDGVLWSACLSQYHAHFDTEDPEPEVLTQPGGSNYGITVDQDGLVWTGGSPVTRYDPVEEEWTTLVGTSGAGIAADGQGSIWVGNCGIAGACRIDDETLEVVGVAADSYGIAVDFAGKIWGIPHSGYVDLVDPGTGPGDESVERILDDCGGNCLDGPYTYSDMSGFQLQNATNPQGEWTTVIEGCGLGETRWVRLLWEATIDEGTSISFSARGAESIPGLASSPWHLIAIAPADGSPVDLDAALGDAAGAGFLEVKATLATARHGFSPRLHSLSVQRSCPDGFR